MLLVFFSKEDEFSINVAKAMNLDYNKKYIMYNNNIYFIFVKRFLFLTNKDIEEIIKKLNIKEKISILVVSKHKSKHDYDMITLHYPGNFNNAELGGEKNQLSVANSSLFYQLFEIINKINLDKLRFFVEATHHGPSIDYPVIFFEIGPNEKAYNNKIYLEIYKNILEKLLNNYNENEVESFILLGSSHYIDKEQYLNLKNKTKKTIAHILPKYAEVELLENNKLKEIIIEMLDKSKTNTIYLNKQYLKKVGYVKELIKEIEKERKLEII